MTLLCTFTDDCDVRLKLHDDGSMACCLCHLEDTDDVRLDDARHCLTHLHTHEAAGQNVPLSLFQRIRDLLAKEPQ